MAQAEKLEQAKQLLAELQAIEGLHRAEFHPAHRPTAPPVPPVDERGIYRKWEKQAVTGIGLFKRAERESTKQEAWASAQADVAAEKTRLAEEQRSLQRELDVAWKKLCNNDPDVVLATLEEAFEDNEAPAAAVGVEGDEVALVMLVPGISIIPERIPSTTQAGNLTLKKMPKGQRASYYKLIVCGHMLLTLRETFAVAPGINSARLVVLASPGLDSYGNPGADCLLAGRFMRQAFKGIQWDRANAADIINDVGTELIANQRGQARELHPIDLEKEPELRALVAQLDLSELTARGQP